MHITGHVDVPSGDIRAAQFALLKHGPLSVAIDAAHRSFVFYANGVYYEPACGEFRHRPESMLTGGMSAH